MMMEKYFWILKINLYFRFTVDPRRRIRQHNGDVANGASKTVKGRPWEMMLVLYGFPTKVSRLQILQGSFMTIAVMVVGTDYGAH